MMADKEETYSTLFKLLKHEETAEEAFNLLERLPVSKKVEEQILSVNKEELDLD